MADMDRKIPANAPGESRHPIIFSIAVTLVFFLSMNIASLVIAYAIPQIAIKWSAWQYQAICETVSLIAGLIILLALRQLSLFKEKREGLLKGAVASGYFIVLYLFSLVTEIMLLLDPGAGAVKIAPAGDIAWFVLAIILIGFTEEIFFRGIISNVFWKKWAKNPAGVWASVVCTGMIFGLMHLFNIVSGYDPATGWQLGYVVGPMIQAVAACFMGMTITTIYYRTRNLWVVILLHIFINLCASLSSGIIDGGTLSESIASYTPFQLIPAVVPNLITVLVLLRPSKMAGIVAYRMKCELGVSKDEEPLREDIIGIMTSQPEYSMLSTPLGRKRLIAAATVLGVLSAVITTVSFVWYISQFAGGGVGV